MNKRIIFIEDFMGMVQNIGNDTDCGIKNIINQLKRTAGEKLDVDFTIITNSSNQNKKLHGHTLDAIFNNLAEVIYVDFEDHVADSNPVDTIISHINNIRNQDDSYSVSVLIDLVLREDENVSNIFLLEKKLLSLDIYKRVKDVINVFLYTTQYFLNIVNYVNREMKDAGLTNVQVYSRRSFDGIQSYNHALYRKILQ
ncbi:MAG: hypothetical protein J1F71_00235 [Clostridiales bacterium]|nr:hypothetical protein [Clostridiales bacterium]